MPEWMQEATALASKAATVVAAAAAAAAMDKLSGGSRKRLPRADGHISSAGGASRAGMERTTSAVDRKRANAIFPVACEGLGQADADDDIAIIRLLTSS
ncbi:hypothetical protein HDU84_008015 [Entophlyctis sp. JEL0112]|nr:hypothetical protein HDU84_008015 [Entophlyctis sp. JEL0112]